MRKILLITAIAVLTGAVSGCTPSSAPAGDWMTVGPDGWAYGDTLDYPAKNDSANVPRSLQLGLRHDAGYEYSNLWLELSYLTPADTVVADTINMVLADDFGRWRGTGRGISYQLVDTVTTRQPVKPGATLHLRHIMRVDTLHHIDKIGLTY